MLFDGEGIELWLKGKACWNSWQIDLSNPSLTISSPRPCVKLGGGNTLIQPRLVHYDEVSNMIPSDCRFIGRAADYLDPNVNVNVLQVNASVFRTRIKPNGLLQCFFFFFTLPALLFLPPQYCRSSAIWVLWIHPNLFHSASSACATKDEKGFWGIECIKQLNKGCHKGSDSTARGRGTGMQSPSPFVLRHTAPE